MDKLHLLLLTSLIVTGQAVASNDVRVFAETVPSQTASNQASSPFSANQMLGFPADVDFKLEPLYPARNNQSRATLEIRYSCVDEQSGGRVVPCYITIDPLVAQESSGGHYPGHLDGRPTGRHTPAAGWVDETTGYLNSKFYSSEIGGIVGVAIYCDTSFMPCRDGKVAFGVGVQGLEDLGSGVGYVLTGAKIQHPSNHWGVPAFLAATRTVAAQFAHDYPTDPLQYNDVSLEYGGLFDVETPTQRGYDWTPPHKTHRLGTNMDIGIPRGNAKRALLLRLCQAVGIKPFQEDPFHWHLIY